MSVTIGIDSSKNVPQIGRDGMFNKHMSQLGADSWRGMTISEALLIGMITELTIVHSHQFPKLIIGMTLWETEDIKDNPDYKNMKKTFDEIVNKEIGKIRVYNKVLILIRKGDFVNSSNYVVKCRHLM